MIVGAAVVEIHIHGSRSLKERRGVVRSISQRLRNRFNVSVAEVGGQDTWQRAALGLSAAGSDASVVRKLLDRAVTFVEDLHLAEVVGSDVELVELPYRETPAVEESSWPSEQETPAAEQSSWPSESGESEE
jgi:uncharacterized protein YlxP (DUF503 family)